MGRAMGEEEREGERRQTLEHINGNNCSYKKTADDDGHYKIIPH